MPVDPVVLHKYEPKPPPKPPRVRDGAVAAAIAAGGTLGMFAVLPAALGDVGVARVFVFATLGLGAAAVIAVVLIGWHEDGVVGVLYRLKHPLGTVLGGDDRPPWTWLAITWVLMLACILSGVLVVKHPGVVPPGLLGRRPTQPGMPGP